MAEDKADVVRRMFELWNRGDSDAARATMDPDVEIEVHLGGTFDGRYRGFAGLAELMRFWGAFGSYRSEIAESSAAGDEVFAELNHYATGKSSGVEVEMRNWQVFTVREGQDRSRSGPGSGCRGGGPGAVRRSEAAGRLEVVEASSRQAQPQSTIFCGSFGSTLTLTSPPMLFT